jgi:hypothetical protein
MNEETTFSRSNSFTIRWTSEGLELSHRANPPAGTSGDADQHSVLRRGGVYRIYLCPDNTPAYVTDKFVADAVSAAITKHEHLKHELELQRQLNKVSLEQQQFRYKYERALEQRELNEQRKVREQSKGLGELAEHEHSVRIRRELNERLDYPRRHGWFRHGFK